MRKLWIRLGLIDFLVTELNISEGKFVQRLSEITEEGSTSVLSGTFESWDRGTEIFVGHIDSNGFNIRRKRKFFNYRTSRVIAIGKLSGIGETVTIETEIKSIPGVYLPYYVFLALFYSLAFYGIFRSNAAPFIVFPFLIVHAFFMLSFPYKIMRGGVRQFKHDLEREFFYLIKDQA